MALLALWNPNIQFLKTDGTINAGGKLVVTDHNDAESIPANYSDADGTTLNASPIVLDSLGRATCYIDDGSTYDLYVKDSNGATLWTVTEMTPGAETIIVLNGFSVSSNDSSVAVVISVDQNGVTNYDLSIQKEIDRATEAEKGLADSIEAEKKRAESAESTLSKSIADETKRATEAEKGLADAIEALDVSNITENLGASKTLSALSETDGKISATATPIQIAESQVTGLTTDLGSKADKVDNAMSGNFAGLNDNGNLTDSGKKASDFATSTQGGKADSAIQGVKLNGASSALTADSNKVVSIPDAVATGTTGATNGLMTAADKRKLNGIASGTESPLMDGKASVGNSLKYAREDHVHPSDTSREDIANKTTVVIGTSDSKYPTDKAVAEFVNSSIATNTANYISNNGEPFTSVEQLEAYSGPVTNNDYAFVTGTDSEGNTYYDRYKATVSGSTVTWALEYRLNNSSFTAAQWAAINSGITSVLVAKIHDHSNKGVLDGITSDKVTSWDGKEDAFDVLPTTKGGTGTNAASKSALTSTLINSLSAETSTPKDNDYYVSQHDGGGTSNTTYVRRPVSALWNYIKGKISSVLGLTASAYSGKAATAGTADKAVADNSGNNIEETYAKKTETEEAIASSVDQTYSSTSTKAQSGVAVNEAFKTRETSSSDDSYTYLGMSITITGTEKLYWKLVSFKPSTRFWTLQSEIDVSNGRKGDSSFDTEIYETKRLLIYGYSVNQVSDAIELRYIAQDGGRSRGYGNNIYYEMDDTGLVTVYIYALNSRNNTQICRLKDVINIAGISNITWYEPTSDAGTQPVNPVKFKEAFPAIASGISNIGSDSVPVYINRGRPVACNSSNLKAGKDDNGNVIKNTYAKKTELYAKGIVISEIDGENVICFE